MQGLISVIVPVYNAEKYILKTIETVINQTYTNWELLLVDDLSTDSSVEIIEDFLATITDERIKLIKQNKNAGAAHSRNKGVRAAKGRYIAFLDADDLWLPDKLELEISFLREMQVGFVFSGYEFGDEKAKPVGKIVRVPQTLSYSQALSRTVIFTSTVMIDTKIISKELLRMPHVASEDTATWWQILRAGYSAHGLNTVLAIYRRPAKSLSSNKVEACKRIWNLYRKVEKLSAFSSMYYFIGWAFRATLRRI